MHFIKKINYLIIFLLLDSRFYNLDKIKLFKKQQTVTVNGESQEIFQSTSPLNI